MQVAHKEEYLFHIFIQNTDTLPKEAALFPHFQYMEQSIRKTFNQLKKTQKVGKDIQGFKEFWAQLTNEDKVNIYCKWGDLLKKSLIYEKNPDLKPDIESITMQDQIFIKKSIFNKWEKRIVKLTPTHFHIITNRKNKDYSLKNYGLRKSKSKQNYCFVLQPINSHGKVLHCGVSNKNTFDEWFYGLSCNIENQRIFYFLNTIRQSRSQKMNNNNSKIDEKNKFLELENKTKTQIMIDNQMKSIDNQDFHEIGVSDRVQEKIDEEQENEKQIKEDHPNIFRKLIPDYYDILKFTDTPVNCPLVQCQSEYRVYELPAPNSDVTLLKLFIVLPFPKDLVFSGLTMEGLNWNEDADVVSIKTKISSQNTALIYEKSKSQGILYRERDFLYLRHCFSVKEYKNRNSFIVDKSIDSIHQPPFMTVVRAEKQLIWGLVQKQNKKQTMLILQGWLKGGGYMNAQQNKEMTLRYMKKLTALNGFLKQISFSQNSQNNLFKVNWQVSMSQENSPRMMKRQSNDENKQNKSQQSDSQQEKQLQEFIERADEQINNGMQKSETSISEHEIKQSQTYLPPPLNSNKEVVIPQQYLKLKHPLKPKQKGKNPNYSPHFRGHHLWKGQWAVLQSGGLAYVDQQKMKEQKKVLTYIIKRIGKNILSGKGILNVSLPVDIFCIQSNIERLAMSFGFFPFYLEKAASIKEPENQLKYVVGSGIASSLIYMTMEKPFNPILGETFQCWVDNCPIYFEQISHHPPIAAFYMVGRGYKVTGTVQAKMDLSINSGKGINEGIFKIQFDNGNSFYYTTPTGMLTGLTYGQRKLAFIGKSFYWTMQGLFLEIMYDPSSKNRGFFGGNSKGQGDQKLPDYFEGFVKQYKKEDIVEAVMKKGEISIPKAQPTANPLKTHYKVHGRWTSYAKCGDQKYFEADQNRYYALTDQPHPLASNSNYREDIVHRRLRNFIDSQNFKQELQIKQRQDRKFRAEWQKSKRKE